jgi:hypothetical protein
MVIAGLDDFKSEFTEIKGALRSARVPELL